jgi:hypothetical protein
MDKLIETINQFTINETDLSFDHVMEELSNLKTIDFDYEWHLITSNYSKLRYLNDIIKNFYIPESDKFLESLTSFMNVLDKTNIYYLETIDFNYYKDQEINFKAIKIKELLEDSLNKSDPIEKLNLVLKGYDLFVPLAAYFRKEKFIENINDSSFLNEFGLKKINLNKF